MSYSYNADGIRVSKNVNDVRHEYYLDGSRIVKETWADQTLEFLYDENKSVYCIVYTGGDGAGRYYLIKNLQGDVTRILNNNLETVAQYVYDPWGKLVYILDADGEPNSGISIANINPIRYRGYYFDMETGFYYLNARYYDPALGRFINPDNYIACSNPSGNNLYSYCWNNPINMEDVAGSLPQFINEQNDQASVPGTDKTMGDISFALGNIANNGCGVIAFYNVLVYSSPGLSFMYVRDDVVKCDLPLAYGLAGVNPLGIKYYLEEWQRYKVENYWITVDRSEWISLANRVEHIILLYQWDTFNFHYVYGYRCFPLTNGATNEHYFALFNEGFEFPYANRMTMSQIFDYYDQNGCTLVMMWGIVKRKHGGSSGKY